MLSHQDQAEDPPPNPLKSARRQIFGGTRGDDTFDQATDQGDLFVAFDGNDTIITGRGNDEVYGLNGNDIIRANAGNDLFDGGGDFNIVGGNKLSDFDAVDYGNSTGAVNVNLSSLTAVNARDRIIDIENDGFGYKDVLRDIELILLSGNGDRVDAPGALRDASGKPIEMRLLIDGGDAPVNAKADGRNGDVVDFSLAAMPVYATSATDRTSFIYRVTGGLSFTLTGGSIGGVLDKTTNSVEIYATLEPVKQFALFMFNVIIPVPGTASGRGVIDPTGLRFTNFEHVIGSSKDDVLALWKLSPGGQLTVNSDTAAASDPLTNQEKWLTDAASLKVAGVSANNPASIGAAADQRVEMARLIPQNQQDVVIEGGAGNDIIIGTRTGSDRIYGGDGNDELGAGGFVSKVYGGAGTDKIHGDGFKSYLWGGDGTTTDNTTDLFFLAPNSFVMDATKDDFAMWGGVYLTGGTQQWWTEGNWAYWAPTTSLLNVSPLLFLGPLGLVGVVLDYAPMTTVRYGLSDSGQLIIQFARGRAGQAVIENYQSGIDRDTSGTAHITIFKQALATNLRDITVDNISKNIDLALRAGFGICFKGTDPLVLDLDGNGIDLIRQDASHIYFDVDHDGFAERTAWVKGTDGFLVRDLNGNGTIDDITEMFGNATTPGFTALKTLDTNNDDKITVTDAGFSSLKVWRDLNSNGVTDAGELFTLAQLGITEISAVGGTPATSVLDGGTVRATGTFRRTDGTTGVIGDLVLDSNQTDSNYLGNDRLAGRAGRDILIGGAGIDMASYRYASDKRASREGAWGRGRQEH